MITKKFEKTYELRFNKNESLYRQQINENLDKPNMSLESGDLMFVDYTEKEILYKDLKNNKTIRSTSISGKQFLIEGVLKQQEWEFHPETKTA